VSFPGVEQASRGLPRDALGKLFVPVSTAGQHSHIRLTIAFEWHRA
jgi:hypothetical protein